MENLAGQRGGVKPPFEVRADSVFQSERATLDEAVHAGFDLSRKLGRAVTVYAGGVFVCHTYVYVPKPKRVKRAKGS